MSRRTPYHRRMLLSAVFAATLPLPLAAQDGPAIDTSSGRVSGSQQQQSAPAPRGASEAEGPAVSTSSRVGSNIIGDQESPIGLYIIPWRASSPTPQMDRPARFVDTTEEPVDETQFRRFVEYNEALTRHRNAQRNAGQQ